MAEERALSLRAADEGDTDFWKQDHVKGHDSKDCEDDEQVQDDPADWSKTNAWNYAKIGLTAKDLPCLKVKCAWYAHGHTNSDLNRYANERASDCVRKRDWNDTTSHDRGN